MRLSVIADTRHYLDGHGRVCTLEPVVVQLEEMATLFDELVLVVPLHPGPPPPGFRPYRRPDVSFVPLRPAGGHSIKAKAILASRIPAWVATLARAIWHVDAIHVRCPCGVALLGIGAAIVTRRPCYAMYAGNWHGYPSEPATYRLQRRLLAAGAFRGPVTVYTHLSPAAPHVVPFFSPTFTLADWDAEASGVQRRLERLSSASAAAQTVHIATVGHLTANKNQATVVAAIARLRRDHGFDARLDVIGDGDLRPQLAAQIRNQGLDDVVRLRGRLPHRSVIEAYRGADFNVLASTTEGYPKVLVEGMVAGAIPVTSRFPLSEVIIDGGNRGVTFDRTSPSDLAAHIAALARSPKRMGAMITAGRDYTRTVTLDAFRVSLDELLRQHWGVESLGRRA